jgi:hypothetical protein
MIAATLALIVAFGAAAGAAPSILGTSGNIITPDDMILAPGAVDLTYHGITDFGDSNTSINFFGGNVGLFPNLEAGAVVKTDGSTDLLINAKYRLLAETSTRPAVTVGGIDIGSQMTDDPGLYVLFSKSLTAAAEEVAGRPSAPLRGHLGIGSGAVRTIFGALDWTLQPKLSLMAEFISDSQLKGSDGGSLFNVGARYAVTSNIRLDAAAVNLDDLAFGISYQTMRF